jgi:hypothetical protein
MYRIGDSGRFVPKPYRMALRVQGNIALAP